MYITLADLFQYSLVLIGIIGLILTAIKRSNRPSFPKQAVTSVCTEGLTVLPVAPYTHIITAVYAFVNAAPS